MTKNILNRLEGLNCLDPHQLNHSQLSKVIEDISPKVTALLTEEEIKKMGVVYTPSWLASHIVASAITQWKKFNQTKGGVARATDLCSGTGIFLAELLTQTKEQGWKTKIFGFDIDSTAIAVSEKVFQSEKRSVEIKEQDTLLGLPSDDQEGSKYQIIVGNPPYVSSASLDKAYKNALKNKYKTAETGAFDLSIIYIEKIIDSLADGGVASIIISNKFMTSAYGRGIARILATECNLIRIEDFYDTQVFKHVTTYTCILTFIKGKPGKRFVLRRHLNGADVMNGKLTNYIEETILSERLLDHPWNFCSKEEEEIIKLCCNDKLPTLSNIFDGIQQGVRTCANDVFVVEPSQFPKNEAKIFKPFVSGEDIKGLDVTHVGKYIIFPYKTVGAKVEVYSEKELSIQFPAVYQYLLQCKTSLLQRSIQANSQWYEYGRRQSLDVAIKKKILVKEMMPSAIFAADLLGNYTFASGYAIDASSTPDDEVIAWAAILSTPVMEFLLRHHGTQLHSGWFRLMKHHLDEIRLPIFSAKQLETIFKIVDAKKFDLAIKEINSLVAQAFLLTDAHVQYIKDYLNKAHIRSLPKKKESQAENSYEPVKLERYNSYHITRDDLKSEVTFSPNKKIPIHNWYKYTQGFSASLVNTLLDELDAKSDSVVLDPFNGCGTTVTTCVYRGLTCIGVEISPLMCALASIKSRSWSVEKIKLSIRHADKKLRSAKPIAYKSKIFADFFQKAYAKNVLGQLNMISQMVLEEHDSELRDFYTVGLLSIMEDVSKIRKHGSHYRYLTNSSSIGLQKLNIDVINDDADIFLIYATKLEQIYADICLVGGQPTGKSLILNESALKTSIASSSVDIVITSPPYLNRNNYISQQKAELDILGLINNKEQYTNLVKSTFRSHTDSNLKIEPISDIKEVQKIIDAIDLEEGNNPKIPHMICGYFIDLQASLKEIHRVLKPGGRAAFVVGNTRWGGIVVPIDHILAMLAELEGFNIKQIMVTRQKGNSPQQMKQFGRIAVRESIVVFSKI